MTVAKRFFDKAMGANGPPDKVAIDKSGANKAAMDSINARRDMPILVRQVKYLNNIVEQDHRAIKRITRPMLNFRSFGATGSVLAGIELIHMIRKGQFVIDGADPMSLADQFSMLAGMVRPESVGQRPFREISSCDRQRDRTGEGAAVWSWPRTKAIAAKALRMGRYDRGSMARLGSRYQA